jgi:hypothetical protein
MFFAQSACTSKKAPLSTMRLMISVMSYGCDEVGDAALAVVRDGPAELLEGHVLVRDLLDDVRPRDEHVARILDHEDEVGDRGGVDGASRARAHDRGYLRDHPRGDRVAKEDVRVSAEARHSLLYARAAAVAQAHDGRAVLHRHIEEAGDLARVRLAEAAPEDAEILREREHVPAVHEAVPADDAVADDLVRLHPGPRRAVRDENAELLECALVEELVNPLAGREPPRLVDLLYSLHATAETGLLALFREDLCFFLFIFQGRYLLRGLTPARTVVEAAARVKQMDSSRCGKAGQRECGGNGLSNGAIASMIRHSAVA